MIFTTYLVDKLFTLETPFINEIDVYAFDYWTPIHKLIYKCQIVSALL